MKELSIIGNLGANAVRRVTSDGKQLMTFNVAVNSGKDTTTWFNCVGNLREKLIDYLVKGQMVMVMGDLTAKVFNGQIDLQISIDKIELVGSAPDKPKQLTQVSETENYSQQDDQHEEPATSSQEFIP